MKTFKPQGAELVEEARMQPPPTGDPYYACHPKGLEHYEHDMLKYKQHLSTLLRYTINPSDWKGITQVKEGEFEVVKGLMINGVFKAYDCRDDNKIFAIPKREEDLFKTAMDNDWSAKKAIAYILEHYTLTKK